MNTLSQSARNSLRITMVYLVVSAVWIFFSDRLLGLMTDDPDLLLQLQTYKGWFFVLTTSVLLYYLIKRSTDRLEESRSEVEEALRQKQAVLSELHHRVKNNLAIICGLIDLQVNELNGMQEVKALETTKYRIFAIAEIEELFYQNSDMASIPFHAYIQGIMNSLNEDEDQKQKMRTNLDDLYLNISQAVPFGLVINEIFAQFRIHEQTKEINSINISLTHLNSSEVSLEILFDHIPSETISRLTNKEHIEAILLDLYIQQLHATSNWSEENGSVKFSLDFEKLEVESSDPDLAKARLN